MFILTDGKIINLNKIQAITIRQVFTGENMTKECETVQGNMRAYNYEVVAETGQTEYVIYETDKKAIALQEIEYIARSIINSGNLKLIRMPEDMPF